MGRTPKPLKINGFEAGVKKMLGEDEDFDA